MGFDFKAYNQSQRDAMADRQGFDFKSYNETQAKNQGPATTAGQAALEHYGNAALMGYLPHLQAAAESLTPDPNAGLDKELAAKGFKIRQPEQTYLGSRDENLKRQDLQGKEHPVASAIGTVGGVAANALITGYAGGRLANAIKGPPVLGPPTQAAMKLAPFKRIADAGKIGAAYGAASNPGDVEGELSPFQLDARVKNAAIGAGTGLATQGAFEALGPLAQRASNWYRGKAGEKAVAAAGGTKADFKKLGEKGAKSLGNEALDSDVVTTLSTPASVAKRASDKLDEAGKQIGSLLKQADQAGAPKIDGTRLGVDLLNDAEVLAAQKTPGAQGMFSAAEKEAEALAQNGNMTLSQAHELRKRIDQSIKFNKRRTDLPPGAQEVLYKIRDNINQAINDGINAAKIAGADAIKKANKAYSQLAQLDDMAANRIAMNSANRAIGLTDTIAGGAGFAAGFASGGDLEDRLKRGLVGASLGLANKVGRTFGSGVQATGFRAASNALAKTGAFANLIKSNPVAAQAVMNRLTQPGGFEREKEDPILNDQNILGIFRKNPDLLQNVQDPKLREQLIKRLESNRSTAIKRKVSSQ